jgi:hypothetical protein
MITRIEDYLIVGHSRVAPDDEIIIGDNCGRFVPITLEMIPELVAALEHYIPVDAEEENTLDPKDFSRYFYYE